MGFAKGSDGPSGNKREQTRVMDGRANWRKKMVAIASKEKEPWYKSWKRAKWQELFSFLVGRRSREKSQYFWVYLNSYFRIRKNTIFTLLNEFLHRDPKTKGQKKGRSCAHITPTGEHVPSDEEKQCNSENYSIFRRNSCLEIQFPKRKIFTH